MIIIVQIMDKVKYIESDIPQSEQKHKGWFYKYPEKNYYRWSDFHPSKKVPTKETAEFLIDYRGFEPPYIGALSHNTLSKMRI